MHAGVRHRIPNLAAAAMAGRRSSALHMSLRSAAQSAFPALNLISIATITALKAATFLEFAELDRYRSVLNASARGRKVS